MRNVTKMFSLLALFVMCALAANVDGKWKGTMETPNGSRETTITLKADGDKLTGSVSGRQNDTPIQDGKIDGDNVSFTVVRNFGGNEMKMMYKGTVSGDAMKLHVSAGEREFDLNLKKQ